MEKNNDKNIDELLKKSIQQLTLDSPSIDFTSSVMKKVEKLQKSKSIVYKPLISKPFWFLIIGCILTILVYSFLSIDQNQPSIINFNGLFEQVPSISIPEISISKTMKNSILVIGLLFLIQIPLLKHYFNKRIDF